LLLLSAQAAPLFHRVVIILGKVVIHLLVLLFLLAVAVAVTVVYLPIVVGREALAAAVRHMALMRAAVFLPLVLAQLDKVMQAALAIAGVQIYLPLLVVVVLVLLDKVVHQTMVEMAVPVLPVQLLDQALQERWVVLATKTALELRERLVQIAEEVVALKQHHRKPEVLVL
jgi:hypothetical protein